MNAIFTAAELNEYRRIVEKIALEAGDKVRHDSESIAVAVQKERLDLATRTDLLLENLIKDRLHSQFPTHSFYAEESGGHVDPNVYTWIIDPLDGTKEFVRDIPIFCITFCLVYGGNVLVSVVYNPRTHELFSAAKGSGAFKNGERVHVLQERSLDKTNLFFRLPDYKEKKNIKYILEIFEKLALSCYRVRGAVNQNIALCWVGMGGYDGFVNVARSDNSWDYAPGTLFLEEAGGKLLLIEGKMIDASGADRKYIAANPDLANKLRDLIAKVS